ncbi:MAG: hypothetical protein JXB49_06275, partial [Bacteroidales bacterium]|nr:hypothetical protein [Bacteroidales bacterium]
TPSPEKVTCQSARQAKNILFLAGQNARYGSLSASIQTPHNGHSAHLLDSSFCFPGWESSLKRGFDKSQLILVFRLFCFKKESCPRMAASSLFYFFVTL